MNPLAKKFQPILFESGVPGLLDYIENSEHHPLTRLFLAFDRRYLGLVQLIRDWVEIERGVEDRGVPEQARQFFDYVGVDLQVNQPPSEFSRPGQPAILLGLNHESIVEPIVLASLLHRNDLKVIGIKIFQFLGPHLAKYILPVLPRKVAADYRGNLKPTLTNRIDPVYQLYYLEKRSLKEIERLNQYSIQQAADHLTSGGVLMIFPTGGHHIKRSWYRGTGQILSLLPPEILATMPIYPILTTGFTRRIFYRKIRQAAFNRQRLDPVQATLYEPICMPPWIADSTPEQMLDFLKEEAYARQMPAKHKKRPLLSHKP